MALNTPKRVRTVASFASSPPNSESGGPGLQCTGVGQQYNHNNQWIDGSMSPVSSCGSPDYMINRGQYQTVPAQTNVQYSGGGTPLDNRRGRPRSEALTTLMIEGSTSPSSIKCGFCNRVFPREKSLQAHLRTHTGMVVYIKFQQFYYFLLCVLPILLLKQ